MKDQFHVKGMGTTMGYVGWIGSFQGDKTSDLECRAESELVRKLEELGAIIFAKTTLVQSLWFGETNNNILGYSWNPRNQRLSSGGSSGGEGAIQALRGSAVGFGTDIGGSVSMPAAFNGVFSIKPSAGRLPTKDMPNSSLGQIAIPTVVGILGPSIETLQYVLKAIMSGEPWLSDPSVLPLPWREPSLPTKLAFGFLDFDGVVKPHPPIFRALDMAKNALEAAGHEVVHS
jgi:amidase